MRFKTFVVLTITGTALAACSGPNPPDAGFDGGLDGGSGDGGPGQVPAGALCRRELHNCQFGFSCMWTRGDAGRIEERCFAGLCQLVTYGGGCARLQVCGYISTSRYSAFRVCLGGDERAQLYCNVHADCADGELCWIPVTIAGSAEIPTVCAPPPPTCDVLTQNCAQPDSACAMTLLGDGGVFAGCFRFNNGPLIRGEECSPGNLCQRGLQCVDAVGAISDYGTCAAVCAADGGSPACSTGTCTPFAQEPGAGACR